MGRQREAIPYSGYAIIAKCSASLQSELQARTRAHTLPAHFTMMQKSSPIVTVV
jgi:hypothetical protein